jgi:hypothetical protein
MLLEEILSDGVKLFRMLAESEEQLRKQLITGDHQALIEAEKKTFPDTESGSCTGRKKERPGSRRDRFAGIYKNNNW